MDQFKSTEVIAGVATGAIAVGALVADLLDKPFIYVRSSSKGHGLGNQIEGDIPTGDKVLVIEDLVSTGMSSLNAVHALKEAGMEVLGMASIFTYGFNLAQKNFSEAGCRLVSLADYESMLQTALEENYIQEGELAILQNWREDPENWPNK